MQKPFNVTKKKKQNFKPSSMWLYFIEKFDYSIRLNLRSMQRGSVDTRWLYLRA